MGSPLRKAVLLVGAVTGLAVIGLFVGGLVLGGRAGGWEMAAQRVGNWRVLLAFALFFPWALLQQTLFQFYLLERFLTLFPASVAITCTGITYGLVHLPDIGVTLATTVAGIVWTYVYYRYRVLSPPVFSHTLLGTLFYYWIYGRDLAKEWAVGL